MSSTIRNLVYNREHIERKVKEHDQFLSSFYLHYLIEKSDYSREELYGWVQQAAFASGRMQDNLQKILDQQKVEIQLPQMDFSDLKRHYQQVFNQLQQRVKSSYGQ
jgi:adenylosuccinate lyase